MNISKWYYRKRAESLAKKVYVQISLIVHFRQEDSEKIEKHISEFLKKFYPGEKGGYEFINEMMKRYSDDEEVLKEFKKFKEPIPISKGVKYVEQFDSIYVRKVNLLKFEKTLNEVEEVERRFVEYLHNKLRFKTSVDMVFDGLHKLSDDNKEILQDELISKIPSLKNLRIISS